jgi:hypothetical protein
VKKQFLIGLGKYGLGIGLLAWMLWRYWSPAPDGSSPGLSGIFQRPLQFGPLVATSVICLASVLLTFYRWYLLVYAQKLDCTLFNAMRLGMIGYFASNFLPGSVTGDVVKAAFLAREQARRTAAVATVIVDRAVGLWGLFWLVALVGAISWLADDPMLRDKPVLQHIVLICGGIVGLTTVLWIVWNLLPARAERVADKLARWGRLGGSLGELWRAMWMYRRQWRWVVVALVLSIIGHIGFVLTYYFAAHTFADPSGPNEIPSVVEHFLLVPAGMTFAAMFPSPGGLGGAEAAFGKLYWFMFGTEAAWNNGIACSLTARMITWGLGLMGYLIYLQMRSQVRPIVEEVEPAPEENMAPAEPVAGLPQG